MGFIKLFQLSFTFLYVYGTLAKRKEPYCTFPTQWQSNVYFDVGMILKIHADLETSGKYYYDYINQQMRLDYAGSSYGGRSPINQTIIWNFNESMLYTINNNGTDCYFQTLTYTYWKQWQGIPGVATAEYFGGLGGTKEIVGQYNWNLGGEEDVDIDIMLGVKVGDVCPPVRMAILDRNTEPYGTFTYLFEFMDITHIKDPSVFTPPHHCKNITTDVSGSERRFPNQFLGFFTG